MLTRWTTLAVIMGLCWGCSESPNQPAEPEENTGQTVTTANNVFADGGPIPAPPLPGGAIGGTGVMGNPAPIGDPAPLAPISTAPLPPPVNTTPGAPLPVSPPAGEPPLPAPGTGVGSSSGNNTQDEG